MRFSAVFQLPLPQSAFAQRPLVVRAEPAMVKDAATQALPAPDYSQLPEDLDQRVRLVGEWQLGMD